MRSTTTSSSLQYSHGISRNCMQNTVRPRPPIANHLTYLSLTGPVVRISPWEVHISDPSYASTHFSGSLKLDKLKARQEWFGVPQASITTPDHDLHRIRHTAISPFFSKKQISKLEPIIASKVTKCCTQLAKYAKDGAVLDLRLLFTCYTTDVVTEYVLASSYNLLDSADLTPQWRETFNSVLRNGHFFKHFPICWKILRAIPYNTIVKMSPDMKLVLDFEIDVKRSAKQAMERDTTSTDTKAPSHPIVFTELLQSDLPPRREIVRPPLERSRLPHRRRHRNNSQHSRLHPLHTPHAPHRTIPSPQGNQLSSPSSLLTNPTPHRARKTPLPHSSHPRRSPMRNAHRGAHTAHFVGARDQVWEVCVSAGDGRQYGYDDVEWE